MARALLKLSIYLLLFLSFASYAHGQTQYTVHQSQYVQSQNYVPGEIIVKLKTDSSTMGSARMAVRAQSFLSRVQSRNGFHLKRSFRELHMYHFAVPTGMRVEDAVAQMQNDPDVQYAEPNYIFTKETIDLPSEHYSAQDVQSMSVQAQSSGNTAQSSTYLATSAPIEVTSTWGNVTPNATVVVAVVDTGLDLTHPVFTGANAIWTNSGEIPNNQIDDDNNGYVDDVNGYNFVANSGAMYDDDGHGTHVSGIIVGTGENIYDGTYSNSLIKIMPLKFLDSTGSGTTANAISAIYYAVNNGASVINNSWGGPNYSAALEEAIAYAYNAGVVFVAAAGNYSDDNDTTPMYPANYNVPNVISVAASTDQDQMAYFSNFGQQSVPLAAPGMSILSTYPGGGFATMSGTSMATPFISGLAALIKEQSPKMLSYQIKQIIDQQVDMPVDSSGNYLLADKVATQGRVNFLKAIDATKAALVQSTQPAYSFSSQDRQLASSLAASGCGLIKQVIHDDKGGGPSNGLGPESWSIFFILAMFAAPILMYQYLRRKPVQRRVHERFKIDTDVRVKVGDRELVGSISSISMGGVQLNVDALIEQGGIIAMSIRSPDGRESIAVEGRIVWSEAQKSYGVQFAETNEAIKEKIASWTARLQRAAFKA